MSNPQNSFLVPFDKVVDMIGLSSTARSACSFWMTLSIVALVVIIFLYFKHEEVVRVKNVQINALRQKLGAPMASGKESFSGSSGIEQEFDEYEFGKSFCGGKVEYGDFACAGGNVKIGPDDAYAYQVKQIMNDKTAFVSDADKKWYIMNYPDQVKRENPEWFNQFPELKPPGYQESFSPNRLTRLAQGLSNT